jgi:hypothetical protein
MGEANPGGDPKYDPSFHVHVNNAFYAQPKRLPAGAYYVLNTNQYQGMTLGALETMKRGDNPNYVFMRDTLQNKSVNFLGLVMSHNMGTNKSASGWLIQDLDTLYRNLREGMQAKEIPAMPILICTNKTYIDTNLNAANFYTWMAQHQTNTVDVALNAVQAWPQDYSHMTVHQDVWSNIRKYVPASTPAPNEVKPEDVLNGIPSWMLWQIGSTMFPMDAKGTMMYFSLNMSFVNLSRLYAWMKYTPGDVDITCPDGYSKDANGVCVKDTVPVNPPPATDWQTALSAMETRLTNLINHPGWMK